MIRKRVQVVVLVVAAGLVVAWVVGAVVKVRRAAASAQCQDNFRQMAMAFENYYGTYGQFPPGTIRNPDLPVERRLSWTVDHWSYLEAHMIRHARSQAWDAEDNRALAGGSRVYRCPANPEQTREDGVGLLHYMGVAGLGPDAARLPVSHPRAGVFAYDRGTRREDVKDGMATTLLLVETTTSLGPWLAGGPSTVRGLDPDGPPYLGPDGQFGSRHPAGSFTSAVTTRALFTDGSVRTLAQDIAPEVFEALATIAGGEEVSPPW
jgi:hypothetical protein